MFEDNRALVTGDANGIGASIVTRLRNQGTKETAANGSANDIQADYRLPGDLLEADYCDIPTASAHDALGGHAIHGPTFHFNRLTATDPTRINNRETNIMKSTLKAALGVSLAIATAPAAFADEATPIYQGVTEELFQTYIVGLGLEELGYDVKEPAIAQVQASFLSVANGDASYYPVFWWPLHRTFWEQNGGDENWQRVGTLVDNSLQGYLIDKATADAHGISSLEQLKDPEIAKLFDIDGDGKADLYGCETGWGCELVIEHHLDAYGLRDTVTHRQGGYFAIIPDAVERVKGGQSALYYTWTPLWLSGVLRPGEEVSWLTVPFTSLPDGTDDASATTVDGLGNLGFNVNSQHVIANTDWLNDNPVANKWFELVHVPIGDINAQNMQVNGGENTDEDVLGHAKAWIAANQATWDGWIAEAKAAQ